MMRTDRTSYPWIIGLDLRLTFLLSSQSLISSFVRKANPSSFFTIPFTEFLFSP
jgi:hypothetical protein